MYLKRYGHGILLAAGAGSALYFIVSVVVTTALDVVGKIQSSGGYLDIGAITDLVSQQLSGAEQSTNAAMIVLLAFWVIGIVDSYRQGRSLEKAAGGKIQS